MKSLGLQKEQKLRVRFEFRIIVTVKIAVCWDVMSCSLVGV